MSELLTNFVLVGLLLGLVSWVFLADADEGAGIGIIRALIFTVLFFAANYYFITETKIPWRSRSGAGDETAGGVIIASFLAVGAGMLDFILRKLFSARQLLGAEIFILASVLALNFLFFAPE